MYECIVNVSQSSSYQEHSVVIDRAVHLSCHTNLTDPVKWIFMKTPTSEQHSIYSGGTLNKTFTNHLMNVTVTGVENATERQYELVINEVQENQTGWYVCIEDDGIGTTHPFLLTSEPVENNGLILPFIILLSYVAQLQL